MQRKRTIRIQNCAFRAVAGNRTLIALHKRKGAPVSRESPNGPTRVSEGHQRRGNLQTGLKKWRGWSPGQAFKALGPENIVHAVREWTLDLHIVFEATQKAAG